MTYFKPLRRKFGVITLLMASALVIGWIRSRETVDLFQLGGRTSNTRGGISASGNLGWFQWNCNYWTDMRPASTSSFQPDGCFWQSAPVHNLSFTMLDHPLEKRHQLPFVRRFSTVLGPDMSRLESEGIWGPTVAAHGTMVIIPYSNLTIPILFLSAYLLLSRPRVKPRLATAVPK